MDLKSKVIQARSKLLIIETKYREVKEEYDKTAEEWKAAVRELEDYDYEQSQVDGRTKTIPKGQKASKAVKDLTLDQIKSIANKLGVSLDLKGAQNEEET